jgi:hypothetical protein
MQVIWDGVKRNSEKQNSWVAHGPDRQAISGGCKWDALTSVLAERIKLNLMVAVDCASISASRGSLIDCYVDRVNEGA